MSQIQKEVSGMFPGLRVKVVYRGNPNSASLLNRKPKPAENPQALKSVK
jgi:hypothetical protein